MTLRSAMDLGSTTAPWIWAEKRQDTVQRERNAWSTRLAMSLAQERRCYDAAMLVDYAYHLLCFASAGYISFGSERCGAAVATSSLEQWSTG